MGVSQLINRKGNPAANQFVISDAANGTITFQSYSSTIAVIDRNGKITLGADFDYSKTTIKHLAIFLQDYANLTANTAKLRKMIDSGEIVYNPSL